uniref:S-adenosyl-L-methionine-dependent methyltransferase n=1 Tax=Xanthomonas albilineans TaxID=29447 RepID=Q70C49_XANAL|nr:putative O-methyltransferase [Xanthomonas albilineans]
MPRIESCISMMHRRKPTTNRSVCMRDIERTALWVAGMRALESEREQALFHDPFARRLAGDEFVEELRRNNQNVPMPPAIEVRTRWLDDKIMQAVSEGIGQVVILAAGMDARAYRLPWPSDTRVYEIDHMDVLSDKHEKLHDAQPVCQRIALPIDLREDWPQALKESGFVGSAATLWLVEGLLCYLSAEAVMLLFARIDALSAKGSSVLFDVIGLSMLNSPNARVLHAMARQFGTDEPESLIQPLGWEPGVLTIAAAGQQMGRWPFPVAPRGTHGVPQSYLVHALKR